MSANGSDASRDVREGAGRSLDLTPEARAGEASDRTSDSGIRARSAGDVAGPLRSSRRPSGPPQLRELTPYQARLDVEMDDTAVSKVRDPSVSIALGADAALVSHPRRRPTREPEWLRAGLQVVLGVCIGALFVVLLVFGLRALGL